jgi:CheY-specific phosphatase CheX
MKGQASSVDEHSYFQGCLSQSVLEFFRDYGVDFDSTVVAPSGEVAEYEMGSVVGFKGENLRGGLAFVAPASLVARMLPVPEDNRRIELQLRDWSGEIANQLAGRLKNKLAAHAFDFEVGAAVCFRGMSIRLSFLPNTEGVSISFTMPAGVRVYLDCAFVRGSAADSEGSEGSEGSSEAPMPIVPEGDVVIFD